MKPTINHIMMFQVSTPVIAENYRLQNKLKPTQVFCNQNYIWVFDDWDGNNKPYFTKFTAPQSRIILAPKEPIKLLSFFCKLE